jgi:hypothetical protein
VPVWTGGTRPAGRSTSRLRLSVGFPTTEEEALRGWTGDEVMLGGRIAGVVKGMSVALDDRVIDTLQLRPAVGDGVWTSERSARSEAGAEADGLLSMAGCEKGRRESRRLCRADLKEWLFNEVGGGRPGDGL